jgi:hypothetical protein
MHFVRFEEPNALRVHLANAGFTFRFTVYEGVDGTWDDVEVDAGSVPLPILVRRTAPPDVARDWPPALAEPHRCGARTLAEVHLGVPSLRAALEAYGRLLRVREPPEPDNDPASGRRRASVGTASGRIVLLEGGTGGVERIVLGVHRLAVPTNMFGGRLTRLEGDPVAWLDPSDTFGLELGFVQG